jgi:hypothetical protein
MATRVGRETMNVKNIDELIKLIPQDVIELYGIRSERYITDVFGNKSKVKAPYAIARKTDNKGTTKVEFNKNISPLINKL